MCYFYSVSRSRFSFGLHWGRFSRQESTENGEHSNVRNSKAHCELRYNGNILQQVGSIISTPMKPKKISLYSTRMDGENTLTSFPFAPNNRNKQQIFKNTIVKWNVNQTDAFSSYIKSNHHNKPAKSKTPSCKKKNKNTLNWFVSGENILKLIDWLTVRRIGEKKKNERKLYINHSEGVCMLSIWSDIKLNSIEIPWLIADCSCLSNAAQRLT